MHCDRLASRTSFPHRRRRIWRIPSSAPSISSPAFSNWVFFLIYFLSPGYTIHWHQGSSTLVIPGVRDFTPLQLPISGFLHTTASRILRPLLLQQTKDFVFFCHDLPRVEGYAFVRRCWPPSLSAEQATRLSLFDFQCFSPEVRYPRAPNLKGLIREIESDIPTRRHFPSRESAFDRVRDRHSSKGHVTAALSGTLCHILDSRSTNSFHIGN